MDFTNHDDMFAQFASFLERRDAGDPKWDADMTLPIERVYFANYERGVKGTSPGGFGTHAVRWHEETGMLILSGLLPDEALDEPDYEQFRAMAWAAMSVEILRRHVDVGLSALERLDLTQQARRAPTTNDECKAVLDLLWAAGDRISWTESLLPAFPRPGPCFDPQAEFLDFEPTLQWTLLHALAGTRPWEPEALRHQAEWTAAIERFADAEGGPS